MSSKNSNGQKKRQDEKLADKFRGACPPHKVNDLDSLVKQCKGDEEKVQAVITQWWDEPQVSEPEWEAVDRKGTKKQPTEKKGQSSSSATKHDPRPIIAPPRKDRPREPGRGVGRGDDRIGRGSARLGDRKPRVNAAPKPKAHELPGPSPVTSVAAPKGAWGQGFHSSADYKSFDMPSPAFEPDQAIAASEHRNASVPIVSLSDPTPSGFTPQTNLTSAALPTPTTGNVWATKGSAHLIRAEKEKPLPQSQTTLITAEVMPDYEEPQVEEDPLVHMEEPLLDTKQPLLEEHFMAVASVLPPSVNGANINASGWEPILEPPESIPQPSLEISQSPSILPHSITERIVVEDSIPSPINMSSAIPVAPAEIKPSVVLNMGHWETGDGDDDELDFGFGSFGPANDDDEATGESNVSVPPPSSSESAPISSTSTSALHASSARPPPGLSMPPMPAGAILVHELETKLENAALGQAVEETSANKTLPEKNDIRPVNQSSQPQSFHTGNEIGSHNYPAMSQYGAYGMGVYSMGNSNGFGSMPPSQFPLGGPLNQQQPKPQQSALGTQQHQGGARSSTSPQTLGQQPPQGLPYGIQNPVTDASGPSSNDGINTTSLPPGVGQIPGGMQAYPNPAFMYGQYNQMGHPAYAGIQYGYGQGQQFGVQGFGYHQVIGQGGYAAPYSHDARHEDQGNHSHMRDNHHANYQKSGGGGYRHNRQNNHSQGQHGGHQYGNTYQAQTYGGGGPYGNNYQGQYGGHDAQFQRGYGGPNDHYGMQQQGVGYPAAGYQDSSDHGKGKTKGPHRVQQGFHQQSVGLQGSNNETGTGVTGGWAGSGQDWTGGWQHEN